MHRLSDAEYVTAAHSLSAHDWEVLRFLYIARYATTDQVYRAFWANKGPEKQGRQACRRRLWELGAAGIVAGLSYQQRSRAWMLDKPGLRMIEQRLGIPEERWIDPTTWKASVMMLDHDIATTEIHVGLRQRLGPDRFRWANSRTGLLRSRPTSERRVEYVRPDATVTGRVGRTDNGQWRPTGWWTAYVEVDLFTERDQVLDEKIAHYAEAWDLRYDPEARSLGGMPQEHAYVLFACSRPERSALLQCALDEVGLPGLAVPMEEAVEALTTIVTRVREHQAELKRRQEDAERQRQEAARQAAAEAQRQQRVAAWQAYDEALARWQEAGQQYVAANKSWRKSLDTCWAEYRQQHREPQRPEFSRPST